MSDSIFLLGADGVLTEVASSPYGSEADLQKLLADHVHLLPGAQINPLRRYIARSRWA